MRTLAIGFVVFLGLAACGGSTASIGGSDGGGGGGGGGGGASSSTGGDASCSGACGAQCSGQQRPDCKCGTPTCQLGTWQCPRSCVADAGGDGATDADASATFPCGDLLACHSASEYCKIGEGGPVGAQPRYSCEPIPAACANAVACACIEPAVGGQLCSNVPGVTVTFEYP